MISKSEQHKKLCLRTASSKTYSERGGVEWILQAPNPYTSEVQSSNCVKKKKKKKSSSQWNNRTVEFNKILIGSDYALAYCGMFFFLFIFVSF